MEEYGIDFDEFQEQDSEVLMNFARDFVKELEYLESFKRSKEKQDPENIGNSISIASELIHQHNDRSQLKNVHREIVKKLHPDVAGSEREEEFKQFQKFWDEGNVPEIINVAVKENVIESLDASSIEELEKSMEEQKKKLENQRRNLRWGWHHSSKDDLARSRVRKMLGINPNEFQQWIQKKSLESERNIAINEDFRLIVSSSHE